MKEFDYDKFEEIILDLRENNKKYIELEKRNIEISEILRKNLSRRNV